MEAPAAAAAAPWVDLPEGLTEVILERLPIADYIRFAAVCPKWRSIQRHHRLRRRSPLPLPWVCAYPDLSERAQVLFPMICFSPFDAQPNNPNPNPNPLPPSKCHSFPLPKAAAAAIGNFAFASSSSHGWLILLKDSQRDRRTQVLLFDPVSGSHLTLPPAALGFRRFTFTGCLSYPPTHPDCALIITCEDSVFLWRVSQPGWTELPCPNKLTTSHLVQSSVFHGGKFYFLFPEDQLKFSLFVVDTFLNVVQLVDMDMDWSHIPLTHIMYMWSSGWRMDRLVECNGDLLMVLAGSLPEGTDDLPLLKGLLVFKADFSRKMWARVESLGDFAIFVSRACSFSLPAADVGVAENSIYFCDSYETTGAAATLWTSFDLGAGIVLHGPPIPDTYSDKYHSMLLTQDNFWFIPRLASVTPTSD